MISVVTGGCGFIGSHIVDKLILLGHEVRVIDDLSAQENESFYYNIKAQYLCKDIAKDDCSSIFKNTDYVFHLAARSRIQPTIGSPNECFEVNVVGTQRVLEWSRLNSVKRVVYSGTSSLYGHQNPIPFAPNMPSDCLNPYSMSKWMGEQVCKLYNQLYGVPSIVLRYFNVYGPREPIKGEYAPVIGLFKRQNKRGIPMTIVAPGDQRRDFTYIDDVIEANICAMNSSVIDIPYKIYNVGTGKNYSMYELAEMILKGSTSSDNMQEGQKIEVIDPRPAEVKETLADIRETIKDLDWLPKHSLKDKINAY
jgi:UDP-glucose 4-epimerase|tara:strand:+ start:39246 stop:40172 length:927 start_codon:yes stop_codon:yes gene_type:complete